jgi:Tfp pilus assembly protein PilV
VFSAIPTFLNRERREHPGGESGDPEPGGARLGREDGLTIIEVLVATIVLTVGLLGTFGLINTTTKTSAQTHDREGAVSLARQIVEDAHTIPFDQLAPGTVVEKLQALPGLENATPGSTWTIVRGASNTQQGATYTVTAHACYIDEPRNGLAKTSELTSEEAAMFCEEHKGNEEWKAGDAVDTTPIDFKRVTVNVSWHATGRTPSVQQVTVFGAAGESTSLSASELKLVPPPEPSCESGNKSGEACVTQPTITTSSSELTFSVCAPKSSTAVLWSLEGVLQSPSAEVQSTTCKSEEGFIWKFKWKIEGLSDGTYQVSAQATTTKGVLGPPVTIPVTLIRKRPAPPKGVKGGFNYVYLSGVKTQVAELQWEASSERNVIGYRVHRPGESLAPAGESTECQGSMTTLSTELTCVDLGGPKGATVKYSVVALYREAKGKVAEGEATELTLVNPGPSGPHPPTSLKLDNSEGTVRLTWKPPTGGEEVAFYRIYRGSAGETCPMSYTSRYDTASALAEPSFTDTTTTTTHTYCVTAVGFTLAESPPERVSG